MLNFGVVGCTLRVIAGYLNVDLQTFVLTAEVHDCERLSGQRNARAD